MMLVILSQITGKIA